MIFSQNLNSPFELFLISLFILAAPVSIAHSNIKGNNPKNPHSGQINEYLQLSKINQVVNKQPKKCKNI